MRRLTAVTVVLALFGFGVVLSGSSAAVAGCPTADASHFTVTVVADSGAGSLRAAIDQASAANGGSVCVTPGLGTITLSSQLMYAPTSGALSITGNGASVTGNGTFGLLQVQHGALAVDGLTMTHGNNSGLCCGGAIDVGSGEPVTVTNSTFIANVAHAGGAISTHVGSSVTVMNSTFIDNIATEPEGGGAIVAGNGVTVVGSTFTGNSAPTGSGGAIVTEANAVVVTNSTFLGNSSFADGGAIQAPGPAGNTKIVAVYSTFSGNTTTVGLGSALYGDPAGSGITLFGSVLVAAPSSARLCGGVVVSAGFNFANESVNSCHLTAVGDSSNDANNAGLEPLVNTGGPTPTLLPGPMLVDRIPNGSCLAGDGLAGMVILTDQRGFPRPQAPGGNCDIGAVEIPAPHPVPMQRIWGQAAIDTSLAVSQAQFDTASATSVVLARSDYFSDALAGGPLASANDAPLLITPGAPINATLDARVATEIQRVLPTGHTVYVLGGPLALAPGIDTTLTSLGYTVVRIQGMNQYATATAIAAQLGNPSVVFEATGLNFADALSAVPAAVNLHGAILLTNGNQQAPETAAYLAAHPPATRYAIGGPLAAAGADPNATPVYGQDLFATSAAVANTFFAQTTSFGAATGLDFPDALSGGVFMTAPTHAGPVLLVNPNLPLPPSIANYLTIHPTITHGYAFGGPLAITDNVIGAL
jgi:predicted outer membrane repeat protein